MNTWIAGEHLMKPDFQIKKLFAVSCIKKILLMKIIYMLKKYLKNFSKKNVGEYRNIYVQRYIIACMYLNIL